MQLSSPVDGVHLVVALLVLLGCTHIALRIDRVVVAPACRRCDGHTCLKHRSSFRHRHQRVPAAIRPAPDTNALFVHIALLSQPYCRFHLITRLQFTQSQIGTLLKGSPATACTAIVHTHTDISLLGKILFQDSSVSAHADTPLVEHLLIAGTAILVHDDRVFLRWVEVLGFYHPAVQFHAL